ncbi:MAG: NUDIX hydrolase [Fluviicola sp.]|nr:NUDIX hydrolase [Fluviicola sp.]
MENQQIKVAVDAVVFGYHQQQLHVLLIKQKFGPFKNTWSIVGGFVHNNEGLIVAIKREIKEETNLDIQYLEQLYTFGDNPKRDPRAQVIAVAYFALVNSLNLNPTADTDALEAQWFPINQLPNLAYDHQEIVALAKKRLQAKIVYQPVGFELLPEKFEFSQLEQLYCCILERDIDRRNFRKKMLRLEIVSETNEISKKNAGRPGKLFSFNRIKYSELVELGQPLDLF